MSYINVNEDKVIYSLTLDVGDVVKANGDYFSVITDGAGNMLLLGCHNGVLIVDSVTYEPIKLSPIEKITVGQKLFTYLGIDYYVNEIYKSENVESTMQIN